MKPILIFRVREALVVHPYLRVELEVLVSFHLVNYLLKFIKPFSNLFYFLLSIEYHQAIIFIDSMVDHLAEAVLGFYKEARHTLGYIQYFIAVMELKWWWLVCIMFPGDLDCVIVPSSL